MFKLGGVFGLIKWDGKNVKWGMFSGIFNDIFVKKWMNVVICGGFNIFLCGLFIGCVISKLYIEGKLFWDI